MKPYKMKVLNCSLLSIMYICSVLYFPLENVVPEMVLHIHYNKPVTVPLTLVHYGKYPALEGSKLVNSAI